MRRFLFNPAVLSSVFAVVPLIKSTATQRRRWKIVLMYIAWGIGIAVAIASVLDDIDEARDEELGILTK